ncbi:hypothetical protein TrLO_g1739 [Triparma laevis f. longispina]|nr:hypothetical protein TrLO_g1739 [Triparma laevis f. longispina]
MAMRLASKPWLAVADAFIDEGVRSGAIIVHDRNDLSPMGLLARKAKRQLASQVIFFLNVTKVGVWACYYAHNLIVVDIPEGFQSIGNCAFNGCSSLTTVSFPTTLTSIGPRAFVACTSLENVDLLNTNLQELGQAAFGGCSELKSMTIPGSLQTLGGRVFYNCSKLVPSSIDVSNYGNDATSEVVAHLRSL